MHGSSSDDIGQLASGRVTPILRPQSPWKHPTALPQEVPVQITASGLTSSAALREGWDLPIAFQLIALYDIRIFELHVVYANMFALGNAGFNIHHKETS